MSSSRVPARRRSVRLLTALSVAIGSFAVVGSPPVEASSVVTSSYAYTGDTQTFTVPAGVTALDVTIAGGQGGRGGHDSQGTPQTGGYRGVVSGTIPVTPGDVVTVAVGGGGGDGVSSRGSAAGGSGGQNPLPGYDGASGGVAGPLGSSGGGGGSGAASVLRINGVDIVAGGAGGNGGSGQFEPIVGRRAESAHLPRPDTTSTTGRQGLNTNDVCTAGFRCDGGAGGAGGGGAVGGDRGQVQYGGATATEYFGFGGFPGANSTAGFAGLTATYEFYEGNRAHGSITITYDNGAPSAPTGLAGTPGIGEATLGWSPPISSGGDVITDYVVEMATNAGGPYTVVNDGVSTTTSTTITGLTNGTTYYFRVAAVNSLGTSPYTPQMSVGVTPSDVPAAPSIDSVTPTDAGLLVDVIAGASDSPITGWQYRLDGGSWRAATISGATITIGGLANGRTYAVNVRSVNVVGASPSSPAVSGTPVGAPSAPSGVSVASGDGTASLTWNPPASDNGAPLTGYLVQIATDPAGPFGTAVDASSSLDTSATVTGLANGQTSWFRIVAVNAVGSGASSGVVSATPFTVPGPPSIASITPGDGILTIGIAGGGDDGGSPITGYDYRVDGGPWRSTGSADTTFTVGGLPNGVAADVEVRAHNVAGVGPASPSASATPVTVPAAPAISTVALDTGAVSVSFTSGADGGSPVVNVEYSIDGGVTWIERSPVSPASPLEITGLTGGVTYPVAVRLVSYVGVSAPSNTSSVTAKGTPEAPGLVATPGDRLVTLSITPPANGGSPITNYEYSVDGGTTWAARTPASASNTLTVTGLVNGTTYDVMVRAVNAGGAGATSVSVEATPRTTPSAPTIQGDTIAGDSGQIDVVFDAPASDGGSAITTYEYSTDAGATWQPRAEGTIESPLNITTLSSDGSTPLVGGEAYPVQVRAVNAAGSGLASNVVSAITTTPPAAPVIDSVVTGDGSATVTFTVPANGGFPISRFEYQLEIGGDAGLWIDTGTLANSFTVSPLDNGVEHLVRVRAVNAEGDGEASAPASALIATTPGAPGIDDVVPGDGELVLGFTPGADGGSAVTGYEYSTDGGVTWRFAVGTNSPISISGHSSTGDPLVNGTLYAVQLRAVNAVGSGVASVTSLVAPLGVPTAPTIDRIDAGDGSLTVRFTPGADGGSSVSDVQYSLDGGATWASAGALTSPVTIDDLDNGVEYDVAVRAVNGVGDGAASAPVSATPRTLPGVPVDVAASAGQASAIVTWTAPAEDGGAAITGYEVVVYDAPSGGSVSGECATDGALTCTVSELANGATVYVAVAAVNAAGTGSFSSPRRAVTPLAPPAVTIASIVPQETSLDVQLAVDDGGAPLTALEYRLDGGDWMSVPPAGSIVIEGLVRGQSYDVEVRGTNALGVGAVSSAVSGVPHTVPGVPVSVSATGGPGRATVTWSPPADDGGQPVVDHVVQFSTNANGPFVTYDDGVSAGTSATVTGLVDATTYVFRVAAVNTAGQGAWSSLASATPLSPPSAPTITSITPGSRFLDVVFTAPTTNGGSAVTGYQYSVDGETWRALSGTASPLRINGLDNGVEYDVRIRAVNAVGGGDASNVRAATPFGLPGAVTGFVAVPDGNQITLTWDAGNDGGSPITSYNVVRWSAATEGSIVASAQPTGTSHTFTGLGNGTYYFTVEAINAAGTGPRTAPRVTGVVGGTLPGAPTLGSLDIDGAEAEIHWTVPSAGSSAVTGHVLQYSTDGSSWITLSQAAGTSASPTLPSVNVPYSLRVAAISAVGRGDFTTITPPRVTAPEAASIGAESATISATVSPDVDPVSVTIEVATDAAHFGTDDAITVVADPASVSEEGTVSAEFTGLAVGTAYLARAIASDGSVTVIGPVGTFATRGGLESTDLDRTYTGSPIEPVTVTSPIGLAVERTYEGVDGTVYGPTGVAPEAAGTYRVTTVLTDDPEVEEVVTLTIAPKELTVSATAQDRPYDGSTAVAIAADLVGVVEGDDVALADGALTGEMADAEPGVDKHVDIVLSGTPLTGADAGNYVLAAPDPVVVTIEQASQSLTFTSVPPATPRVGGSYTPTAVSDRGLPVTIAVSDESAEACSIQGAVVTFLATGSCELVASAEGDRWYLTADPIEQRIDVLPALATNPAGTGGGTGGSGSGEGSGGGSDAGTGDDSDADIHIAIDLRVGTTVAKAWFEVVATGLTPNSPVRIELHSEPELLRTARADAAGDLRVRVQLPDSIEPGLHHIVVIGTSFTGAPMTAREPLLVDWSGARADHAATGGFVAIDPVRVLDTRAASPVAAGEVYELSVDPSWGLADDANAVTVNVTATRPAGPGYVSVYPCGSERPEASLLNVENGRTVANVAVVGVDGTEAICLFTSVGTDLVVDLNGVHVDAGGHHLASHTPNRVVDTRSGEALAAGRVLEVPIAEAGSASAAMLNVTVVDPTDAGFLTVFPCGGEVPVVSNLNFVAGQTVANGATVKLGDAGSVCLFTSATTDVLVDVTGTFSETGTASLAVHVPGRMLDTRGGPMVSAGSVVEIDMVGDGAAPAGTTAVALNVTAVEAAGAGYLSVSPCGADGTRTSNLNVWTRGTVANHVTGDLDDQGRLCVFTSVATHLVIDVEGVYRSH